MGTAPGTILVPLLARPGSGESEQLEATAVDAAFRLAKRLDAHVHVVCMHATPEGLGPRLAPWIPGAAVDELLGRIEREAARRYERAREMFEVALARHEAPKRRTPPGEGPRFSADFAEASTEANAAMAREGRHADLIVLANHPMDADEYAPLAAELALDRAAAPVLMIPFGEWPSLYRRIAIGWNGSREAARAVLAAGPFLEAAERVDVITIAEDGEAPAQAGDIVRQLAWRGIAAHAHDLEAGEEDTGTRLLARATAAEAELLVTGARLRERLTAMVLGGATRTIFADAELPVLMTS